MKLKRFMSCLMFILLCFSAFPMTAFANSNESATSAEPSAEVAAVDEALPDATNIVSRDLLYDKATNKQFITIQDRKGNTFYLVIDYDSPLDEAEEQFKTYFLNPVDPEDLAALADQGKVDDQPPVCICEDRCVPGHINMNCPVCASNMPECMGIDHTADKNKPTTDNQEKENVDNQAKDEETQQTASKTTVTSSLIVLVIVFVAVIAYIVIKKLPRKTGKKEYSLEDMDDDFEIEDDDEDDDLEDSNDPEEY